jgi:hypothetical protein
MRKTLIAMIIAVLALPLAAPMLATEANALPKCRNVAGYEPKATCEARNQRAQWQAEQTARLTAQLVAQELAQADAQDNGGIMDTLSGLVSSAIETVSGLF